MGTTGLEPGTSTVSWWRSNQLSYAPYAVDQATSRRAAHDSSVLRCGPVLGAVVSLPDGRRLCYDDVGDRRGVPVLYVHGMPDSRRARHPDDALAGALGIRLVAVDRPGAGGSDLDPDGTLGSFGDDASVLADHLGIDRWTVLGWSAGALFSLAVAARRPDRVERVGIVAGVPPAVAYAEPGILDGAGDERRTLATLAREVAPAEAGEMLAPLIAPYPCDHALARDHVLETADPLRRAELDAVPGSVDAMAAGVVDAVAAGLAGLAHDVALELTPPDVDLVDVRCPVLLWYGSGDRSTPPAFGAWFADRLPDARLEVVEGAGHLLLLTRWTDVLTALTR